VSLEKRTTFRGARSEVAESSSESVAPAAPDAEFFRLGSSRRMPRCSFVENEDDCERPVVMLRFERGVDGVVLVSVDNDAFDSDGVSEFE
jgi:hypothetical protein